MGQLGLLHLGLGAYLPIHRGPRLEGRYDDGMENIRSLLDRSRRHTSAGTSDAVFDWAAPVSCEELRSNLES